MLIFCEKRDVGVEMPCRPEAAIDEWGAIKGRGSETAGLREGRFASQMISCYCFLRVLPSEITSIATGARPALVIWSSLAAA